MTRIIFVTGTDTGVGKTAVTAALLLSARAWGLRAHALKPVAAGGVRAGARWLNDDAALFQALSPELSADEINLECLPEAIAPHIAARSAGRELHADPLVRHIRTVADTHRPDILLVEGAGGWLVPLNSTETLADVAGGLHAEVVLVVGMRLGCLNHALLTAAAIRQVGLRLGGWVANGIDPAMPALAENIASLEERLPALRLGTVPWLGRNPGPDQLATWLDGAPLWNGIGAIR